MPYPAERKHPSGGEADWDAVVWIDDVLGEDLHEWARQYGKPVLLEKPVPDEGLTEAHVVAVQVSTINDGVGELPGAGSTEELLQGEASGDDVGGCLDADEAEMPGLVGVAGDLLRP
jgi:hypothetical protein